MGGADTQAQTNIWSWSSFLEAGIPSWFPQCGSHVHTACGSRVGGKPCDCATRGWDSTELPDFGPERDLSDWPKPANGDALASKCYEHMADSSSNQYDEGQPTHAVASAPAISPVSLSLSPSHMPDGSSASTEQQHRGPTSKHPHSTLSSVPLLDDNITANAPVGKSASETSAVSAEVLQTFIRKMLKGHTMQVCSINGNCVDCVISLDAQITSLCFQRAGKRNTKSRSVPLDTVREVLVGSKIPVEVDLPLDDNCATLLLTDGQAVAFRLRDVHERNQFALFLNSFAKGRRDEIALDATTFEDFYAGLA